MDIQVLFADILVTFTGIGLVVYLFYAMDQMDKKREKKS